MKGVMQSTNQGVHPQDFSSQTSWPVPPILIHHDDTHCPSCITSREQLQTLFFLLVCTFLAPIWFCKPPEPWKPKVLSQMARWQEATRYTNLCYAVWGCLFIVLLHSSRQKGGFVYQIVYPKETGFSFKKKETRSWLFRPLLWFPLFLALCSKSQFSLTTGFTFVSFLALCFIYGAVVPKVHFFSISFCGFPLFFFGSLQLKRMELRTCFTPLFPFCLFHLIVSFFLSLKKKKICQFACYST